MKKMKLFLGAFAFLAVGMLFTACNPDTTVTITLSQDSIAAEPGDVVTIEAVLTPDAANKGELGPFSITDDKDLNIDTTFSGSSSVTYTLNYTVPEDAANTTISIKFTATDGKSSNSTTETAVIYVGKGLPEMLTKTDVQPIFITDDYEGSTMSILLNSDDVTLGGSKADGDLVFVYQGSIYGNCLLSPDNSYPDVYGSYNGQDYDYANKKKTFIVKDNSIDFDNLDEEKLSQLTVNESDCGTVGNYGIGYDNINKGDIFKIKTADGRIGVVKVTDYQFANPGKGTLLSAYAKFDVKYQKTPASSGK